MDQPFKTKHKFSFLMGLHSRCGAQSSLLHSLISSSIFDQNLLRVIFSLAEPDPFPHRFQTKGSWEFAGMVNQGG